MPRGRAIERAVAAPWCVFAQFEQSNSGGVESSDLRHTHTLVCAYFCLATDCANAHLVMDKKLPDVLLRPDMECANTICVNIKGIHLTDFLIVYKPTVGSYQFSLDVRNIDNVKFMMMELIQAELI